MVILNKNKVSKILYNKNRVSKILLNKKLCYTNELSPEDIEGKLNYKLPDIPGISDYFIFLLLTHKPITKRETLVDTCIIDLCSQYVRNPQLSCDFEVVKFSKFGISLSNSPYDGTSADVFFGNYLGDYVNGSQNLSFGLDKERIVTSHLSSGIISFFEGSQSHYKPIEGILDNFSICANIDDKQIISMFLIGQGNKGTDEPLKQMSCKIDFSMDNNIIGESAYNAYTYCIHSSGKYKLLTKDSFFNRDTNKLEFSYETDIFDCGWFDKIEGT